MPVKRRCPKCGHPNTSDAVNCANCGAPLTLTCPKCGTIRPWFVADCPHCAAIPKDTALFHEAFGEKTRNIVGERYELRVRLASGAVSRVYRGVDTTNPTADYAIKELFPVAMFRADEKRELDRQFHALCDTWRTIDNQGIARIVDVFAERERYYVVSEYIDGWSMKRIIEEQRIRTTPDLARNWAAQLCTSLSALYVSNPGLHVPFLAPQHIMVSAAGEVKIIDLGLTALFMPRTFGPYGSVTGYAAPELKTGKPSAETDQFAVGRILYALLTERLLEMGSKPVPLQRAVPGISQQLVKTIARAARREPEARFATIDDLTRELWSGMDGELVPVNGWVQLAQVRQMDNAWEQSGGTSNGSSAGRTSSRGMSMATLGFDPDPRFGQSREPISMTAPVQQMPTPAKPVAIGKAELSVTPGRFSLVLDGLEEHRENIKIRNIGTAPARVSCKSTAPWLHVPDKTFTLKQGKTAQLIFAVNSAMLPPGDMSQQGNVVVTWEGAPLKIDVHAFVPAQARLQVETPLLDFGAITGDSEYERDIVIRNAGGATLTGTVGSRVPWLTIAQKQFTLGESEMLAIPVKLLPERLESGRYDLADAILLDSDAGQDKIAARVSRRSPVLYVENTIFDLGALHEGDAPELTFMLANKGNALLTGTIRAHDDWLHASPSEFALGPGEAATINLFIDIKNLDGPNHANRALLIESNGGTQDIALHLDVLKPRLALRTSHIDFGTLPFGQTAEQPVDIANTGRAPLSVQIAPLVPWLQPNKQTIQIEPGQNAHLVVHLDPTAFEANAEFSLVDALLVKAGTASFVVRASVIVQRPQLTVEPETIDFGYVDLATPVQRELVLTNSGTGALSWQALIDALWVEFSQTEGRLLSGESVTITATAYGMGLEKGVDSTENTLIINSDGGRAKVPLIVGVANPRLACHTAFLDLGESINRVPVSATLRLFNYGMGTLTGTVRSDQRWLVLDHVSFEASTGRSVIITATTDMDEFPADSLYETAKIQVESNGGDMELSAAVNVMLEPDLIVVDNRVDLVMDHASGDLTGRLILLNQGLDSAHVELIPGMPQLVVTRTFCDVKPGKRVRIAIHWQGEADWDPERAVIRIVGDEKTLTVPVTRPE